MRFSTVFVQISLLLFLNAAAARDLSSRKGHRLLLRTPKKNNTVPSLNKTVVINAVDPLLLPSKPSNKTDFNITKPPFPHTPKRNETTKPKTDLLDSKPPMPPFSPPLTDPLLYSNISSLLPTIVNMFSGPAQNSDPVAKPSTARASLSPSSSSGLNETQAEHVACDVATIIRVISGLSSPTSLYSSLISGSGSGVDGGNAIAKIIAATNAGSTFSNNCSVLKGGNGLQTLSSAVMDLLGPSNNSTFAQSLLDLTNFIDSTSSNSATGAGATVAVSKAVPSYLSGTQLGNVLSTIESGIRSSNPLAKYNATQLFKQILSRYGSYFGSSGELSSFLNSIGGGLGSGSGAFNSSTLLTEIKKILGGTTTPAGTGGLASAFASGLSSAFGSGRRSLHSENTFY